MGRWQPLFQLFLARFREFAREPEVIFWVYGFPVLLAVGLGIAFSSRQPDVPLVDVQDVGTPTAGQADILKQLQTEGVRAELHSEFDCRQRYRLGKTALIIVPTPDGLTYIFDPTRQESVQARYQVDGILQRWKAGIQSSDPPGDTRHWSMPGHSWRTADSVENEPGNRYIDFLLPGLMGMNLMGGGLWGVGFVIVDMRVRKLLKRLLATPMRRSDFLLSILIARLVFMLPEMLVLLLVGRLIFGVPIQGSFVALGLAILAGAMAFSGIGLLVASRTSKTETASGLMNLVMLPMWLLSGIFFSSRRFPEAAQPFIQSLPLTQLNDALREVMLEGASPGQVGWRVAILTAWALVGFLLALKWFRWQ